MQPQVELLVHVSGPSRLVDDARYRREVQAFLDFEVAERHDVTVNQDILRGLLSQASDTSGEASLPSESVQVGDSFGPTQRNNVIRGLFQQRIQGVTPIRQGAAHQIHVTPGVARSLISPALPWTSVKETPRLLIERTPAIPRPRTAPNHDAVPEASRTLRRAFSDSYETPPSVVQDSQLSAPSSANQPSSSPRLKRPFASSSSPTEQHSSPTRKRARHNAPLAQQPSKKTRPNPPSSPATSVLLPTSSQPEDPDESIVEPKLPLLILPPYPLPGMEKVQDELTIPLKKLAQKFDHPNYDIICEPNRDFDDKMEKGQWVIPFSNLDPRTKRKMWTFLEDFVGKGKAGWGVTCFWELVGKTAGEGSEKENQSPELEEVLRVFCWGHVQKEVFLMLFAAAGNVGKSKPLDAKWLDADGKVVVVPEFGKK